MAKLERHKTQPTEAPWAGAGTVAFVPKPANTRAGGKNSATNTFDDKNGTSLQNLPPVLRSVSSKMTAKMGIRRWGSGWGKNDANEALRQARTKPPKTEK